MSSTPAAVNGRSALRDCRYCRFVGTHLKRDFSQLVGEINGSIDGHEGDNTLKETETEAW